MTQQTLGLKDTFATAAYRVHKNKVIRGGDGLVARVCVTSADAVKLADKLNTMIKRLSRMP